MHTRETLFIFFLFRFGFHGKFRHFPGVLGKWRRGSHFQFHTKLLPFRYGAITHLVLNRLSAIKVNIFMIETFELPPAGFVTLATIKHDFKAIKNK